MMSGVDLLLYLHCRDADVEAPLIAIEGNMVNFWSLLDIGKPLGKKSEVLISVILRCELKKKVSNKNNKISLVNVNTSRFFIRSGTVMAIIPNQLT